MWDVPPARESRAASVYGGRTVPDPGVTLRCEPPPDPGALERPAKSEKEGKRHGQVRPTLPHPSQVDPDHKLGPLLFNGSLTVTLTAHSQTGSTPFLPRTPAQSRTTRESCNRTLGLLSRRD